MSGTLALISGDELRQIVRDELEAFQAARDEPDTDILLTVGDLARRLQCSPRTVYSLRKEGLPTVLVGESPRFEWDAVRAWLRQKDAG